MKNQKKRLYLKTGLKGGKNRKEEFFKIHAVNTESEVVTNEFERHLAWIDKTGLRATPTILVNSYKLPDNYKIEDLKYL